MFHDRPRITGQRRVPPAHRAALWLLAGLLCGLPPARAHAQTIAEISPRTLTAAATTTLTITGTDLASGVRAAVSVGRVSVQEVAAERATLEVTLPADAAGSVGLWLFTAAGPHDPVALIIDDMPAVVDTGSNHAREAPQQLSQPCCVDGQSDGPQADWFRFHAQAGERLAFEVLTQSLGSAMDPVLVLRDADGGQLAMADDDGVSPESRLSYVFAEEGDYLLELRESRHAAGGRYHLRIGDFPVRLSCHPLALQRDVPTTFVCNDGETDRPLADITRTIPLADREPHLSLAARFADGSASSATRVLVSDLPQQREEEIHEPLAIPVGISGRLQTAGERDSYPLVATAGEKIRVRPRARSLGSEALISLRLLAADGSVIAETSPTQSDEWPLEATLPADGEVRLEARDLLSRGGHRFGYHLEITRGGSVEVSLAGDANTRQVFPILAADGAAAIPLSIERQGNDQPVQIAIDPPIPGLRLLNAVVPAAAKEHRLVLAASEGWTPAGHAVVRLTAKAVGDDGSPSIVSSIALQRAREPRVLFPEAWHNATVAAGGAAAAEAFFTLAPTAEAVFARPVQSHTASLTLARSAEAFKEGVTLLGPDLPPGWSLAATAEADTYSLTLTRSESASEPATLSVVAYGELAGRGRLGRVELPISWIDPLAISAQPTGPLVAGTPHPLPLEIVRRGPDPQPVTLTVTEVPEGWPIPEPLTVPADQAAVVLPLRVPATASGGGLSIAYTASSQFQGQAFTISGRLSLPKLVPAPVRIEVFPQQLELASRTDRRQMIVSGFDATGAVRDWTHDVAIRSADPSIAELQGTAVVPVGDGQTELIVEIGSLQQRVPVAVGGSHLDRPVAFESEVLVALSKQGCSSGACHGSPSGKGLFRLSLRGFDAALDQLTLIHEDFGRRVNTFDPEASLLLAKPLMQVSHGGGKQLHHDDTAYRLLRRWIAEGARPDPADTARCVGIEIHPGGKRVLALAGGSQQLAVLARFADGSVRDVTQLVAYESSNASVATVTPDGHVLPAGRGETVILARFLEHIESVPLTFLDADPAFVWTAPPPHNVLDERVDEKLQLLQHTPSPLCTDEEFLRRVHLDVIGLLPTVEETRAFLADPSPDKRQTLIDTLLRRDEYATYQALKWGDILRMTKKAVGDDGVYKYHRWVEDAFRSNMPYDEFARAILAAEGSTLSNPPANFYRAAATATDCVETVSQVFLGARLQCAKCHNHPFEKWTQDNYYGLAAFFEPVQRRATQRPGEMFIYTAAGSGVTQPRTGERMQPWLPGEGSLTVAEGDDGRERLVDWLVDPGNPFFARIEANRIWSGCFARGIVDPIDDFRDSNPPANGPLLDALTDAFIKSGFDRKALLRLILSSRTYQASVATTESNAADTRAFSHQLPRLLAAEPLLDAIGQVTGVPETFAGLPAETKATQLPAPDVADVEFLEIFGQPQRSTVCACERTSDSNLGMAIAMFNGELMHQKLGSEANRFRRGLAAGRSVEELIEELYLAAVCRVPDDAEMAAARAHVETRESPAEGLEDVCWALLNTDEFLFQH